VAIDVATMTEPDYGYFLSVVVDQVDDAEVTDPDPPQVIASAYPQATGRARVV